MKKRMLSRRVRAVILSVAICIACLPVASIETYAAEETLSTWTVKHVHNPAATNKTKSGCCTKKETVAAGTTCGNKNVTWMCEGSSEGYYKLHKHCSVCGWDGDYTGWQLDRSNDGQTVERQHTTPSATTSYKCTHSTSEVIEEVLFKHEGPRMFVEATGSASSVTYAWTKGSSSTKLSTTAEYTAAVAGTYKCKVTVKDPYSSKTSSKTYTYTITDAMFGNEYTVSVSDATVDFKTGYAYMNIDYAVSRYNSGGVDVVVPAQTISVKDENNNTLDIMILNDTTVCSCAGANISKKVSVPIRANTTGKYAGNYTGTLNLRFDQK